VASITGANAVYTLAISPPAASPQISATLFATPIQLQGFAADDSFSTEPLASVEVMMGVDGLLSAGFVYVPVRQTIAIQADSTSNALFDAWWNAMQVTKDVYFAQGVIILTATQTKYSLVNGALTQYHPLPDVKKLLQPRRYGITWQSVTPAPVL